MSGHRTGGWPPLRLSDVSPMSLWTIDASHDGMGGIEPAARVTIDGSV